MTSKRRDGLMADHAGDLVRPARHGFGFDPGDIREKHLRRAAVREMHDRYGAPGFSAVAMPARTLAEEFLSNGRSPAETRNYRASWMPIIGGGDGNSPASGISRLIAWTQACFAGMPTARGGQLDWRQPTTRPPFECPRRCRRLCNCSTLDDLFSAEGVDRGRTMTVHPRIFVHGGKKGQSQRRLGSAGTTTASMVVIKERARQLLVGCGGGITGLLRVHNSRRRGALLRASREPAELSDRGSTFDDVRAKPDESEELPGPSWPHPLERSSCTAVHCPLLVAAEKAGGRFLHR